MFFQHGKQRCTPVAWATKHMSWKIILPLELVKPMLWAAAAQNSRSGSVSSTSRNQSTQFWLPIPIRNSTLDLLWPHEQARKQQHAKRQRRDVGSHHERSPTADLFLIEPHVWSQSQARGEHDVKFATDMNNLYKASQGYVEPGKDKMPDWWYAHFWDELRDECQKSSAENSTNASPFGRLPVHFPVLRHASVFLTMQTKENKTSRKRMSKIEYNLA